MRWLSFLILGGLASAAMADSADSVRVCYNYGCLVEQEVHYSDSQLTQLRDLIGIARNAEEERERLSLAIGQLLAWAGEQSPISADRGGNFADDGVYGRMDCIDHSTTTTLLLQLLADHGWLHFHRVAEPAWRVRYLFELHYSAQIEELAAPTADGGEPARFVVDSWFRDNGRPAAVLPLANWLDGEGQVESGSGRATGGGFARGSPR
ncbi:MAG TPA: hypothetical protein PLO14_05785 [Accumulibacter sp.]|uniref:hypothetical protein n=1 Tax=Accumulibacter sp. TaxID=2053492 RepID=UPI0025E6F0E0|nr:hypothetical protein [Accumulibacter sp.]MCM8600551.1 hypothetical protein [Accumulibacter sp.]MCM8664333.1 hypothetical protein [Accumulibacter sp.]HNC51734.1 hypothetical protein [Accumulibacter sp.]